MPLLAMAIMPVYRKSCEPSRKHLRGSEGATAGQAGNGSQFHPSAQAISQVEREAALARTLGCLSTEEADEMEKVIEEGCEQIDEHGW
jgi:phage terminase small subunit